MLCVNILLAPLCCVLGVGPRDGSTVNWTKPLDIKWKRVSTNLSIVDTRKYHQVYFKCHRPRVEFKTHGGEAIV